MSSLQEREISHKGCFEKKKLTSEELSLDKARIRFILISKFRKIAGKQKLGIIWMGVDPIVTSLIYLFVFTVIRANPNPETIFIGITLFRILQTSVKNGVESIQDFSGGLLSERVRTRVLIIAMIKYRLLDNLLQSIGVALVLLIYFESFYHGVIGFLIISQILGLLGEGFGLNFSKLSHSIPDIKKIIHYILMIGFFASPALYPMSQCRGIHYKINEYNPFAYFVEISRDLLNLDSVFWELDHIVFTIMISILIIMTINGYNRIDNLRWRISSWT